MRWLCTPGENVVDDVVIFVVVYDLRVHSIDVSCCIFDDGCVGSWEVEILGCVFLHDRVNLDNGGVDAVGYQC